MSHRRFLYLDSHLLTAYAWSQGHLLVEDSFIRDDSTLAAFSRYLTERRHCQFALLVNHASEEYIRETVPFLFGNDRQALIARKISQYFTGSPPATAFSLGYEKTRRRNEKLLFAALTNPADLDPWLQCIAAAEAPLAGIYTVAQLGGQLLKKLGGERRGCLLLTMQDQSIRESYLRHDRTLFSRMAPLADSSAAGIASSFVTEVGKLRQYLIGQRLISHNEHLPIMIVAHPATIPAIREACPEYGHLDFTLIPSHAAAARLGLKTLPEDNRCDLLYLQLLASDPPRQQFASASHRHNYRVAQLRRGIVGASLIALLGGLLFAAHEAFTAHELRQESQVRQIQADELEAAYRSIAATFPQLDIDNDTLHRLSTQHATLVRQQQHPEAALRRLGQILDQTPAIALDRIEWQIGRTDPGAAADAPGIDGDDESIVIHGHIQSAATAREALTRFDEFIDRLRHNPDNQVRIVQQAVDMASERALRGGDGIDEADRPQSFIIEISRTAKP
ncbi:MAG: hypothetical protein FWF20_04260 [Betaproteobacteria bacterium]|nr:hypothetical protein [Betaproteobacteria bacterium]MCL2885992.1 hypothetical protein [Betaproteobacteria bacterium]